VTGRIGSAFIACGLRILTPVDHELLRRSKSRSTILGPIGVPLLLLTTTGRKSGQRRQIPLTYMREGDRLFLLGSNFGQAAHPAWSSNLLADPNAWVTMGGKEITVVATQLTGAEARPHVQKVRRLRR
jgi:deazaflavin-dependent oxidoreductase (nitroreductase family)